MAELIRSDFLALKAQHPNLSHYDVFELFVQTLDPSVIELEFSYWDLNSRHVSAIATCSRLKNLRRLVLVGNFVGNSGAKVIAESSFFSSLTSLRIESDKVSRIGFASILRSPHLESLTELSLCRNQIASRLDYSVDPSYKFFENLMAQSPRVELLTALNLGGNDLRDTYAREIVRSPRLKSLTSLDISDNELSCKTVEFIVASQMANRLRYLRIGSNNMGDEAASLIANSSNLAVLRELDVSNTSITESGIRLIAESRLLSSLESVYFRGNGLKFSLSASLSELRRELSSAKTPPEESSVPDSREVGPSVLLPTSPGVIAAAQIAIVYLLCTGLATVEGKAVAYQTIPLSRNQSNADSFENELRIGESRTRDGTKTPWHQINETVSSRSFRKFLRSPVDNVAVGDRIVTMILKRVLYNFDSDCPDVDIKRSELAMQMVRFAERLEREESNAEPLANIIKLVEEKIEDLSREDRVVSTYPNLITFFNGTRQQSADFSQTLKE